MKNNSGFMQLAEHKKKSANAKTFLWCVSVVITVAGLAGFTCFIFEEAMQMQTFGAFAYQSAKDWDGLDRHVKLMERTHSVAEFWIVTIGWLNPIMYPAYLEYLNVNENYIDAMKNRIEKENGNDWVRLSQYK